MTSIYRSDEGKDQVLHFYENILKHWHQPSKQLSLDTSFGMTFILESGAENEKAVILLHGSSSNSAMWTADVAEISKNYHVFAIDIIGECGKSSEDRPPFKNKNYAQWLMEIMNQLGLEKAALVSCSLGGWIALDFATNYPERTEKLILLTTAGLVNIKAKTLFWIIATSFLGQWGFIKLNKLVYNNLKIDKQALEFASLLKDHYKPRTEAMPLFNDEALQNIRIPTLFIGGENDCFYDSKKAANRLEENLENIECKVIKETGHVLIDQTQDIMRFLKIKHYA